MNAEQYLDRARKIESIIVNKMEDHKHWVEIATGLGGFSVGDKVKASRNLQQIPNAIGRYIDIEAEIEALQEERQSIILTIEELPTVEYLVIYMIYVKDYPLKAVALELGKSYDWVKNRRQDGLNRIQKILNARNCPKSPQNRQ